MKHEEKKSSRLLFTIFILLNVKNNPHGCLYKVVIPCRTDMWKVKAGQA
jgi:hypothetical protein